MRPHWSSLSQNKFRRQAWSLEKVGNDALARFWQGPDPKSPEAWPYEGDWLTDVRRSARRITTIRGGRDRQRRPWCSLIGRPLKQSPSCLCL